MVWAAHGLSLNLCLILAILLGSARSVRVAHGCSGGGARVDHHVVGLAATWFLARDIHPEAGVNVVTPVQAPCAGACLSYSSQPLMEGEALEH